MGNQNSTVELYVERNMYATGLQRFANSIIDVIAFYIILIILGVITGLLSLAGVDGPLIWFSKNANTAEGVTLNIAIYLSYYFICEAIGQRTLGKLITGTKVVMEDGSKPYAAAIAVRCLCRLIPFEAFSFFAERSRGWHDSIAQTYVVNNKKYMEALMVKKSINEIGSEHTYNL